MIIIIFQQGECNESAARIRSVAFLLATVVDLVEYCVGYCADAPTPVFVLRLPDIPCDVRDRRSRSIVSTIVFFVATLFAAPIYQKQ
jgi:hypothetical protein